RYDSPLLCVFHALYFLCSMPRRPPTSTPFPTRRSSDLRRTTAPPLHGSTAMPCMKAYRITGRLPAADVFAFRPGSPMAKRVTVSDRKSTRLNSSHVKISYAVFCLKKKNKHALHRCNTKH